MKSSSIILTLLLFAASTLLPGCDSDSNDNESPREGAFRFGEKEYLIDLARHTYLGTGDGTVKPGFNLRFEGMELNNPNSYPRVVMFYIFAEDMEAKRLPAGSYNFDATATPETRADAGTCYQATFYTSAMDQPITATSGSLSVSTSNNIYTITGNFTFEGGYKFSINYRGAMSFEEVDDPHWGHDH